MLLEGSHYDSAIDHYKQAIELCDDAWPALEGLAQCLGSQGKYQEAIEWQEKAINAIPEDSTWISAYLWPRLANGPILLEMKTRRRRRPG